MSGFSKAFRGAASMNAIIEDGRGNRLVYKPSPLQQPRLRAAPVEAPPPPRERTMIVPLEALNIQPKAAAPKVEEPAPAATPARSSRSPWVFAFVAAVLLALVVMVLLFR